MFYVWVTAASDSYTEPLVGRLIRRNWRVTALGNTLSLHSEENLATLVAFSMAKVPKDDKPENLIDQSVALDEVKDVLKRLGVHYYSLVVVQPAGCTWCIGNITHAALNKAEVERKIKVN